MRALELPLVSCWTGSVAAWAPFPAQAQPAGTGLTALKSSSRGVWLKSAAGGVLTVQLRGDAPPLLICSLRRNAELVRTALLPTSFAFKLLCPQHSTGSTAGGSGGHLLLLSLAAPATSPASVPALPALPGATQQQQQQHEQVQCTIAVQFDTAQAGRECGALLQAIQAGRLRMMQPLDRPEPANAVAPVAATAIEQVAYTQQQQQAQQQQAQQQPRPEAQHAKQAVWAATAASSGAAEKEAMETAHSAAALFGHSDSASLVAAIQAVQADPEFLAYVQQLERAVEAVEGLMLGGAIDGEGAAAAKRDAHALPGAPHAG